MRENLFHKIVKDENDFTELLCNMFKYKEFKHIFIDFIKIESNYEVFIETQFKTNNKQKNGRPDMIISYDDAVIFLESKVGNTKLTKNQPEGYIKELKLQEENYKELIFLIPGKYKHLKELNDRIKNCEHKGIKFNIKTWEEFFEYLKKNKIYLKNIIINEYYNLLKSWFGYEIVSFSERELKIMNENAKIMIKAGTLLESIGTQLDNDIYNVTYSNDLFEIGISISNKRRADLGWVGIWFSLWEKTGDCFIYTISESSNKKYFNNLSKISKKIKLYEFPKDDGKSGKETFKYICFDDIIFNKNSEENIVLTELKEILKKIVKGKL